MFCVQVPVHFVIAEEGLKSKPRKDQILDASARLFRRQGYPATSVRMIASELSIEAASLYNHIASKQEILQELLVPMARLFTNGMNEIEASPRNPFQKLEALVALHVKLTYEFPNQISLITGEWIHLEGPVRQQYLELRTDYEVRFKRIIAEGMESGHLQKTDVDLALFSILSTLHWLYSWTGRHKEVSESELVSTMQKTLLEGLKIR